MYANYDWPNGNGAAVGFCFQRWNRMPAAITGTQAHTHTHVIACVHLDAEYGHSSNSNSAPFSIEKWYKMNAYHRTAEWIETKAFQHTIGTPFNALVSTAKPRYIHVIYILCGTQVQTIVWPIYLCECSVRSPARTCSAPPTANEAGKPINNNLFKCGGSVDTEELYYVCRVPKMDGRMAKFTCVGSTMSATHIMITI